MLVYTTIKELNINKESKRWPLLLEPMPTPYAFVEGITSNLCWLQEPTTWFLFKKEFSCSSKT
jgi:hypothetical protein